MYPMKTKRKAVREELDVVNVVEWRGNDDKERWFLLVRRPRKGQCTSDHALSAFDSLICCLRLGLLAGLHEFPTMPNVSRSKDLQDIPRTLLSELLSTPLRSDSVNEKKANCSSDLADDINSLRITMVQPAGDVVHVFSHLKKTYRVQWVLLEAGGVHPPRLRTEFVSSTKTGRQAKAGAKASTKIIDGRVIDANHEAKDGLSAPIPPALRWVAMQDVTDAKYVHF
jgi:A/G-specific adenine glycosylase